MAVQLRVYESVLTGSTLLAHLRPRGNDWRRSIRALGGSWQGTLTVRGEIGDLVAMFYNWLGGHIEESAGIKTWQGLVYEIELEHEGVRRIRTLDQMANAIDVSYQTGGEVSSAGFSTQAQAIARYGRKEARLSVDNMPAATAQAYQARYLAQHAWPAPRPVAVGQAAGPVLTVRACGYAFTANWLFVQAGDGAEHDIDHWISAVVGTAYGLSSDHGGSVSGAGDCQFLMAGNLASNTLQVAEVLDGDLRPWSLLEELAGLGDSSGDPWRVWVDLDRKLQYAALDLEPAYYLRDGKIYDTAGGRLAVDPWAMQPGIVRDLEYPIRRAEQGSAFADARDLFVEQVEVTADGAITMSTAILDESEILAAQASYQQQAEAVQT